MGTGPVRGKTSGEESICLIPETTGEEGAAASAATESPIASDQFISQSPPQAPDSTVVPTMTGGVMGRSLMSSWPPKWANNPGFQSVDPTPYEELKALIERNGRLLEKYAPYVPEELAYKLESLNAYHAIDLHEFEALHAYPDDAYRQDLYDRNQILQRRILDLGRELGETLEQQKVPGTRVSSPNLNEMPEPHIPRPPIPPPRPKPPSDEEKVTRKKTGIYPALINQRYPGLVLTLRNYQRDALRSFEADLSRATHLGEDAEDFEGTLVLPTGSGKTRLMSAMMALTIAKGYFVDGDKIIVTTHLKNVTAQNLAAIKKDLAEDFQKKFGRELKVSAVAGNTEDWSGDVVVLSIPKVGRKDFDLRAKLKAALGEHRVPLMIMDEIHHGEAASWKAVKEVIRTINGGKAYVMGLTATPTGTEPNVIYRESAFRLMQAGALPNVYLVEGQTGIYLDGIKRSKGDFDAEELQEKINTPQRNRLMIELLERHGIRNASETGLAPTLMTAVERRHAWDIAQAYAQHFQREVREEGQDLRGREIQIIGSENQAGKIVPQSKAQIEQAVKDRAAGKGALIAVVTGDMKDSARDLILENWKNGNIEAVINVGVYKEGFDGWFVQNLVSGKATLSAIEKGQEAGRITRRGPEEVDTKSGKLLKDIPRVAIDLQDIYKVEKKEWSFDENDERNKKPKKEKATYLQTYRESFGYGHKVIPRDTLWDLVNEHTVGEAAPDKPSSPPKPTPKPSNGEGEEEIHLETPRLVLTETLKELQGILEQSYQNNLDEMAFDLGLQVEELKRILSGESPLEAQLNLARRLGTLLYLERERFVNPYFQDLQGAPGTKKYRALQALKEGLEIYLKQTEQALGQDLNFTVDTGVEKQTNHIKRETIVNLFKGKNSSQRFAALAQGLVEYFDQNQQPELGTRIIESMNRAYGGRLEWDKRLAALKGMSWRELGILNPEIAKTLEEGKPIYLVGNSESTIKPNGSLSHLNLSNHKPQGLTPFVTLKGIAGKLVVTNSGGRYHNLLSQALREARLAEWGEDYAARYDLKLLDKTLSECKHLEDLKALGTKSPQFLKALAQEQWGEELPPVLYLVGSSMSTLNSDGRIKGRLSLSDQKPLYDQETEKIIPFVELKSQNGQLLVTDSKGNYNNLLSQTLREAGLAEWDEDYAAKYELKTLGRALSECKSLEDLKTLAQDDSHFLTNLAQEKWGEKRPNTFYIIGSSTGTLQPDGFIKGHLSLSDSIPGKDIPFVKIEVKEEKPVVTDSGGNRVFLLSQSLREARLVEWSEAYAAKHDFNRLEKVLNECKHLEDFKTLTRHETQFLTKMAEEKWGTKRPDTFYLVGSNMAILQLDGRIYGRLSLSDAEPGGYIPFIKLEVREDKVMVTGSGGTRDLLLSRTLHEAELAEWSEAYAAIHDPKSLDKALSECKSLEDLKTLSQKDPQFLTNLAQTIWREQIPPVFYLVGSNASTLQPGGNIKGRLSLSDSKPEGDFPFVKIEVKEGKLVITDTSGSRARLLAQTLREAGLAGWSKGYVLSNCESLEALKNLGKENPEFFKQLVQENWGEKTPEVFYLVGSNMGTLQPGGHIQGYLNLSNQEPAGKIPFIKIEKREGKFTVTDGGGNRVRLLIHALCDSGFAELAPEYQPVKRRPQKGSEGFVVLPNPKPLTQFAQRTAIGAIPFAVGEYTANAITGHKTLSLKEFAEMYIPLSVVGGASHTTVDGILRKIEGKSFFPKSPWIREPSASTGKAITRRVLPLFMTFAILDALKQGHVDPAQLSLTVGNILVASTTTHALGASLTKVKWVNRLAHGLHLLKAGSVATAPESAGVTLLGACLASAVEFTILKVLGDAEQKYADYRNENKIRESYAQVIQKNDDLLATVECGQDVELGEVQLAQQELLEVQAEYENFFQAKIDRLSQTWQEQRRDLELEEMEEVTQRLDGTWSRAGVHERYAKRRKNLASKYDGQINEITAHLDALKQRHENDTVAINHRWEEILITLAEVEF